VSDFIDIPDVPVAPETDRVSPNQVAPGVTRGAVVTPGADGYPQVLQGNQKTFGNGFYVAKPANDVTQVTDATKFIFNSNQNVFKIVQSGTVTITYTASNIAGPTGRTLGIGSATVTHNLGYVPALLCYGNDITTQYKPITSGSILGSSFSNTLVYQERIDIIVATTTIVFNYIQDMAIFGATNAGATNGTQVIKYYLLQETAS
jgi:hypothetical protein